MALMIKISRWKGSYLYKRDADAPFDWYNNDGNNGMDTYEVFDGEDLVFKAPCQTVSNMQGLDVPTAESPAIKFEDTIVPGPFQLKVGLDKLDPRAFYGRINGICNTKTIAGDEVNENSVTEHNFSRWLNHDRQKHKPNPPGVDTRVCWSAGCTVMVHDQDLENLGALFDKYGYNPGDMIDGVLVEVD